MLCRVQRNDRDASIVLSLKQEKPDQKMWAANQSIWVAPKLPTNDANRIRVKCICLRNKHEVKNKFESDESRRTRAKKKTNVWWLAFSLTHCWPFFLISTCTDSDSLDACSRQHPIPNWTNGNENLFVIYRFCLDASVLFAIFTISCAIVALFCSYWCKKSIHFKYASHSCKGKSFLIASHGVHVCLCIPNTTLQAPVPALANAE